MSVQSTLTITSSIMRNESFRSILGAVDFSEQSRHALRWAGALAARFGGHLTVVAAVDPLLAEAAKIRLGQDLAKEEIEPALREFVAETWPDNRSVPAQIIFRTVVGDPASSILEAAAAERADLIVMGTQGLGGFKKWLLGSTTERLLRRTTVPVMAVPLPNQQPVQENAGLISHILAATDFSDASVHAANIAADLARVFSAKLTLIHVIEPVSVPSQWLTFMDDVDETRVRTAHANLDALAEQICGPQRCEDIVALGRPADQIGSIADEKQAQLIVMGLASDEGAFAPRPGSIAYRVLSSTAAPVLVVPTSHTSPHFGHKSVPRKRSNATEK